MNAAALLACSLLGSVSKRGKAINEKRIYKYFNRTLLQLGLVEVFCSKRVAVKPLSHPRPPRLFFFMLHNVCKFLFIAASPCALPYVKPLVSMTTGLPAQGAQWRDKGSVMLIWGCEWIGHR